jgi:hypothetical protein
MPDHRKPATSSSRTDNAPPPADGGFSIETTTMRLKSLKLRRTEAADKALDEQLRGRLGDQVEMPAQSGPTGRVRHDERGMAVWDCAAASGEVAGLSASNVMRKLDVSGLSIEQTQRSLKAMQTTGRDVGGGSDPYNQRGYVQRTAPPMKRPAPTTTPVKPSGASVLDQLTGKKK